MGLEGSWLIENLAVGGELVPTLATGPTLRLSVDGERVSGSSGVNRFTGSLGEHLVFSPLATTRMAGPEELMAQEDIVLRHLGSIDSFESSASELLLLSQGQVVLTLVPSGTDPTE